MGWYEEEAKVYNNRCAFDYLEKNDKCETCQYKDCCHVYDPNTKGLLGKVAIILGLFGKAD